MRKSDHRSGFTLIEILITVSVVGLLMVVLLPAVSRAISGRENARCASQLRSAVAAFEMYRSENGSFPADRTPGVTPPEMVSYFEAMNIDDWWGGATDMGGRWDWDNGYNFKYSVSISSPTKSAAQLTDFDKLIDDGNLSTGMFRKVGSQYHYIIER
jgi:prepilin-type N-terminal cleavage/methylation domain-containing protein